MTAGTAPPQFRTIPEHQKLSEIERMLRFHPSEVSNPEVLSRDAVGRYNQQGFLAPLEVFSPTEADGQRAYFDELLDRVTAAGGNSYSISTAHLKYGRVYDLLSHPRIVAYVKDILGENVVGWGSHYFCKMPGDGKKVHWHQDSSYWPLSVSKTVTVWLAIDDSDTGNGCLRVIPGSHLQGHLTYRLTEDCPDAVLNQEVENAEQFGRPVDLILRAGQISMHSDLLLHGSEPNMSTRRRCGLTLRYCTADVRAGMDWNLKGVLVSGQDPSGHWANPPRPETD